jgi:hypothetical protein
LNWEKALANYFKMGWVKKNTSLNNLEEIATAVAEAAIRSEESQTDIPIEPEKSKTTRTRSRSCSSEKPTTYSRDVLQDFLTEMRNKAERSGEISKDNKKIYDALSSRLGRLLFAINTKQNEGLEYNNMQGLNTKELCIEVASYMDELNNDIDKTVNTKINTITATIDEGFNEKLEKLKLEILNNSKSIQEEQQHKFAEQFNNKYDEKKVENCTHYYKRVETVKPPAYFSLTDQLPGNPTLIKTAASLFPVRWKFGGNSNHGGIIQFLEQMTNAQNVCQLSRSEFMTYLLTCTTSKAYDIVSINKFINRSIEEIYDTLLSTYDKSIDPETAKMKLFNYSRDRHHNLQNIESDIVDLAAKASLPYLGEARISHFNHEAIDGLIRALPKQAKIKARDIQQELSTPDALPSFHLFSQALRKHAHAINDELKATGHQTGEKYARTADTNNSFLPRPRTNTQSERSGARPKTRPEKERFQNGYRKFQVNELTTRYDKSHFNKNKQNEGFKTKTSSFNKLGSSNESKALCRVCGRPNHKSSDGCIDIRVDSGAATICPPTSYPCPKCQKERNLDLWHPIHLCPRREIIQKMKREGTLPFINRDDLKREVNNAFQDKYKSKNKKF